MQFRRTLLLGAAVLAGALLAPPVAAQDAATLDAPPALARPASFAESGRPVTIPEGVGMRQRTYGFLAGRVASRILEPGKLEVTFTTEEPTLPAAFTGGINTLEEETDYPRFHYFMETREEGSEPRTEHRIVADFSSVKKRMHTTPFEPRIVWRVEVFLPKFGGTRFLEGRTYYDPATMGDTTNVPFGPTVEQVTESGAIIAWDTDRPADGHVQVIAPDGTELNFSHGADDATAHEVVLNGLEPDTVYTYQVRTGTTTVRPYAFRTAGAESFAFAAMVDSREGNGGGMNNFYGVNGFSLYALGSDLYHRGAAFVIVAGDLINGYTTSVVDYRNMLDSFRWMMGPVHARLPIYESMGNHETLLDTYDTGGRYGTSLDKQGSDSAEAWFGRAFVNPPNGPENEGEGTPPYAENVYVFDHGHVRVLMLNNNYWWSSDPHTYGGNLEGYFLPAQMQWLREQVAAADADPAVRLLFAAAQEPPFPNGGHTRDAMWYKGGDTNRDDTIDERDIDIVGNRNTMWSILASSPKMVAFITGDEHAYSRLMVEDTTPVGHKIGMDGQPVTFAHPVWQVTSGGAGAPWYDKELDLPWSGALRAHSTQPHYAFFRVDGDDVVLESYSQTGQRIDAAVLRRDGANVTAPEK